MSEARSSQFAAEAAALVWLAGAGIDTLVDASPRNWLAEPAPAAAATRPAPVLRPPASPLPAVAGATVAGVARNDASLTALVAALADFDHPLRRASAAPQLFSGAIESGIIIIADQPELPGSAAARLRGRMLAAIGLDESRHGILNLLPWQTLDNGPPREAQVAAFAPFVARALVLARPTALLALGTDAAALAGPVRGIASARGRWRDVAGVPLLTTFHPRSLIAQPSQKPLAWADLQAFAEHIARTAA